MWNKSLWILPVNLFMWLIIIRCWKNYIPKLSRISVGLTLPIVSWFSSDWWWSRFDPCNCDRKEIEITWCQNWLSNQIKLIVKEKKSIYFFFKKSIRTWDIRELLKKNPGLKIKTQNVKRSMFEFWIFFRKTKFFLINLKDNPIKNI
jgi:hypothetical protein